MMLSRRLDPAGTFLTVPFDEIAGFKPGVEMMGVTCS
jgi:hypothetical protein